MSRLPAYALALALAPFPVFAQEDDGTFLEGLLERNLSGAGRDVQISGFRGALSSTASFDRLTIADDVGIWLTLEDVTLEWSRSALLRGALVVDRLTAGSIDLPRLPQGGEEQEQLPSPEAPGFSLPELPVSVQIGIIASPSISIGEPVFGVASDFSLEAGLSLIGGEGAGRLDITRIDGPEGRFQVDAAYSNATEVLTAALTLAEAPGGIFSTLAGLPGEPSVDLIVNGQGPLSDFEATLALATDGEERLGGTLVIGSQDAQPGAPSPFRADVAGNIAPLLAPAYRDFVGDEVSLLVAGQRAPDGALDLETFTLDAGQLRLDGQLSRGADGLLRSFDVEGEIASDDASPVLLPLPGEPTRVDRVTLDAAFDAAEGETWQGAFRIFGFDRPGFSAETLTLDGDGTISATGGAFTANFDFAAEALDLGDPAAEAALGERVTGRIELSGAPDALVEIGRFDIAGETYVLESSGTLDVADRDLGVEGRARIRAQDLTVFSGIAGRPLSGSAELSVTGAGTLLGRAFDVVVDGQTVDLSIGLPEADRVVAGTTRLSLSARRDEEGLALRAFRLGSPVARVTAEGTLRSAGTVLNLSASIDDGSLVLPGLDGRHSLSLMAQGTGEVWNIRSSLTGATLGGSVEGQLDDEREVPVFDGVVTLDARSLAPLAAPAGLPALSGGLSLRLDGSVFGDLSRFDVRITGSGSDVTTGIDVVDPLLAGAVSLSVDAARVSGPIVIRDLSAETETLSLEGAGTLDGLPPALLPPPSGIAAQDMVPSFEGRLALRADNLAPASRLSGIPGLAGAFAITLEGTAVADLSEFDLVLDAEASGLTLGRADLDTFLSDGPLSLTISAEREAAGPVALRTLSLATGSLSVGAGGVLTGLPEALAELDATTFADAAFEGELSVAAQSVAPLGPLLGRPGLSGTLDATLTGSLAGDLSQFDIRLVAREEALTLGLPRFDPLLRGGLAINLDAARAPDGPVELRAFDLESPAVTLRAEGAITGLPRSLTALEPNALDTAAFDGSARIDADNLAPLGPLVGLPGLGGAVQATVEGSVAADFEDLDVRLDANGVNLRTGIAALDTYLGGGTVLALDVVRADGRFDIRRARFASPGLTAEVEGQLGPEDGDLAARVTLDDLGRIIDGISGRATADLTARRSGGAPWRIDSTVDGPGGTALRAEGTVAPAFDRVDLTLRGAAPLAFANPFIAPRALGGQARFDLRVAGPPALSSVSGRITTDGARLVAPTFNIIVDPLNAVVDLSSGRATIDLRGDFSGGGRITVSGPITLTAPFPGDLAIRLNSVRLTDPSLYETIVSGNLTIAGPLAGGARIGGRIALGPTELRIPSGVTGGTAPIPDITHVGEPADVRRTRIRAGLLDENGNGTAGTAGGGPAYPLDVQIVAENQIFIRGRGLDAELGGSIRLGGTTANIIPAGQFSLVRGRLDILGRRLVLQEGSVTLQGDFDPFVRLVALADADDVTVRVVVEGTISDPTVRFSSEPDLPEDEVLARLLFGRGIATLSAFQAAQLAASVATLTGQGGEGLLDGLRENFGLDDLDVTTDDEGGVAVRAGRYLSDNVYTDVVVSEGQTSIEINLDLTRSVTVTGRASDDGESSIGIYFERDY